MVLSVNPTALPVNPRTLGGGRFPVLRFLKLILCFSRLMVTCVASRTDTFFLIRAHSYETSLEPSGWQSSASLALGTVHLGFGFLRVGQAGKVRSGSFASVQAR